eukprot:8959181-Alexandrium_andersonii.AAC.1
MCEFHIADAGRNQRRGRLRQASVIERAKPPALPRARKLTLAGNVAPTLATTRTSSQMLSSCVAPVGHAP